MQSVLEKAFISETTKTCLNICFFLFIMITILTVGLSDLKGLSNLDDDYSMIIIASKDKSNWIWKLL